jgi:hypothetical protein
MLHAIRCPVHRPAEYAKSLPVSLGENSEFGELLAAVAEDLATHPPSAAHRLLLTHLAAGDTTAATMVRARVM